MGGFTVGASILTPATDKEFQSLARALHAVRDRADAEEVLRQAQDAVGWENGDV